MNTQFKAYKPFKIDEYLFLIDDPDQRMMLWQLIFMWKNFKMKRELGDDVLFNKDDFPMYKSRNTFRRVLNSLIDDKYITLVSKPKGAGDMYRVTLVTDRFIKAVM